jgi:hypothetical protein
MVFADAFGAAFSGSCCLLLPLPVSVMVDD